MIWVGIMGAIMASPQKVLDGIKMIVDAYLAFKEKNCRGSSANLPL